MENMDIGNIRKGITQAHFNEQTSGVIMIEIFIISGLLAWHFKSWFVFGGVLLGLVGAFYIPVINIILACILSAGWGYIGYSLGHFISQNAAWVIGALALLAGIGAHLAVIEWARDLTSKK